MTPPFFTEQNFLGRANKKAKRTPMMILLSALIIATAILSQLDNIIEAIQYKEQQ
jgi:hypothetical protein